MRLTSKPSLKSQSTNWAWKGPLCVSFIHEQVYTPRKLLTQFNSVYASILIGPSILNQDNWIIVSTKFSTSNYLFGETKTNGLTSRLNAYRGKPIVYIHRNLFNWTRKMTSVPGSIAECVFFFIIFLLDYFDGRSIFYFSRKWPLWVSEKGSKNLFMAFITEVKIGEMAIVKELMYHGPWYNSLHKISHWGWDNFILHTLLSVGKFTWG